MDSAAARSEGGFAIPEFFPAHFRGGSVDSRSTWGRTVEKPRRKCVAVGVPERSYRTNPTARTTRSAPFEAITWYAPLATGAPASSRPSHTVEPLAAAARAIHRT